MQSAVKPLNRDEETLVRQWAVPGMDGLRHRIGGLEKLSGKGSVSTDSANHEQMVKYRKEKVERVANRIPNQEVEGAENADLLVVGWGGTEGALRCAVQELQAEGKSIARVNDMVVFIPYGAPGDIADVKIDKKKHSYAEGHIVNLVN